MTHLLKSLPLVALIALGTPVFSQGTDGETGDDATPNPMELNMGEPDIQVGQVYVEGEFTDWEIRCIRSENGFDPCQLYQLLDDGNGNPVAEINIFPIFDEGQAVAGATVVTPLETLLTEQLSLSVDGGNARKYPFSWCSQIGCFSRMGFTEAEIQQFRAGAQAQLMIVPVVD
ncbi:MAG: invasion associated locus B family protein, partial [Pseudomonadota bacterium]